MTVAVQFFDRAEYGRRENARMAEFDAHKVARGGEIDWPIVRREINWKWFPPGSMYECPWFFDPANPEREMRREFYLEKPDSFFAPGQPGRGMLSPYYWRDWLHIRPPLYVMCPNGDHWCLDQLSSDGIGWKVTGEPATITASPSIQTGRYHGFLQNGRFTADCERPGAPNGVLSDGQPA